MLIVKFFFLDIFRSHTNMMETSLNCRFLKRLCTLIEIINVIWFRQWRNVYFLMRLKTRWSTTPHCILSFSLPKNSCAKNRDLLVPTFFPSADLNISLRRFEFFQDGSSKGLWGGLASLPWYYFAIILLNLLMIILATCAFYFFKFLIEVMWSE